MRQQALAIEATAALVITKAMLKALPFERWRGALESDDSTTAASPPKERLAEVVWAVDRVSSYFPEQLNCLPRAISVRWMMSRRNWPSQLKIGVARDATGKFEAHAWVEHEGMIIIGQVAQLERYSTLPGLPDRAKREKS